MEDPEKYPGMAHFVEHLLFMGTKTYPRHFWGLSILKAPFC
ncbi:MAG: hypothetical protein C5B45_05470 [Chlamydiae bacterium]|nr:MAG: hypothetical protein C5B45_05470 [Chlamydiota bacterium]